MNFSVIMPAIVSTELATGSENARGGLPQITPEIVAASVIKAIKKPKMHIAVPEFMETAHSLYGLLPGWVKERGRRLMGDDRILTKMDAKAHAGYAQRIASLATRK